MIATIRPPTTGAGMQNVSRKRILFLRNCPRRRTPTAIASVRYLLISIVSIELPPYSFAVSTEMPHSS